MVKLKCHYETMSSRPGSRVRPYRTSPIFSGTKRGLKDARDKARWLAKQSTQGYARVVKRCHLPRVSGTRDQTVYSCKARTQHGKVRCTKEASGTIEWSRG
jgi:hypothetical protein